MSINISTSSAIFTWQPACWLRITGSDAATFLQGQFTNDLKGVPAGGAVYGLWLSVKGKVLADSFVVRGTEAQEFWVGSYFSPVAVIRDRLESFVIADDVVVDDATDSWRAMTLFGAAARSLAEMKQPPGFVFPGRRSNSAHLEWVFPSETASTSRKSVSAERELTLEDVTRLRIADGIPAVPMDVGPADLPNEGGLEAQAISYTKGCYLGQEVMARLKSMGQVRRRLVRVSGSGAEVPRTPVPVFAGARQVGEVRSAVREEHGGWIGLAMVSLLHVSAGAVLAFAPEGAADVRVGEIP